MAGYAGYSKSKNALQAESENKFPLTIAVKELAKQAGITQKRAREIFKKIGPCEWHHASKFYNRVDYYNLNDGLEAAGVQVYPRLNESGKAAIVALVKGGREEAVLDEAAESLKEDSRGFYLRASYAADGCDQDVYFKPEWFV
jgi:hypothetical protein